MASQIKQANICSPLHQFTCNDFTNKFPFNIHIPWPNKLFTCINSSAMMPQINLPSKFTYNILTHYSLAVFWMNSLFIIQCQLLILNVTNRVGQPFQNDRTNIWVGRISIQWRKLTKKYDKSRHHACPTTKDVHWML